MPKLREKFIVDAKGKPTAVVLDIVAYRALLQDLDDLRDALELDEAVRSASSFRPYEEVRAELKRAGRL